MGKVDSFEDFLQKKKQEEELNHVDWNERRSKWQDSVEKLYSSVREWLSPFVAKSLLLIKERDVEINEQYLGVYKIKRLDIYLGNDLITLLPKGTLIIGSYGRVDMKGPKGEIMIIQPEWKDWKLAKRTPKFQTWNLTSDSFKEAFLEVTDGK